MFFTTLSNCKNIEATAQDLVKFRMDCEVITSKAGKDAFMCSYFDEHFSAYESWKNANEYADNIIRYFRLTRFFYLRGNDFYIDLEPRRKIEIDSILETDNASAKIFESQAEYSTYIGDITKTELPWETKAKLQSVIDLLSNDIKTIENELRIQNVNFPEKPQVLRDSKDIAHIKVSAETLRIYRRKLLDIGVHAESQLLKNIENCIKALKNIFKLKNKKPVELERQITNGLHALNDALEIRPNYPVGDDNQPTFTAPANKPDIECFYKTFNSTFKKAA
jgi:hypothetical protein